MARLLTLRVVFPFKTTVFPSDLGRAQSAAEARRHSEIGKGEVSRIRKSEGKMPNPPKATGASTFEGFRGKKGLVVVFLRSESSLLEVKKDRFLVFVEFRFSYSELLFF